MGDNFDDGGISVDSSQPRLIEPSPKLRWALDIAGASIFGALSIALSFSATFIPRIPGWYIALFDPISLIWLLSFLIFGPRAGLLTMVVGTIGLMPFDPTVWLGPMMKFASTIWLVVIPWAFTRMRTQRALTGEDLRKWKNYVPSMLLAWAIRCVVMVGANILVLKAMMPFLIDGLSLEWLGFKDVVGLEAVAVTVVLVNTLQTLADAIIPYILVFASRIYDRFAIY